MRPAREGRENDVIGDIRLSAGLASMRPAREGRENSSDPMYRLSNPNRWLQ